MKEFFVYTTARLGLFVLAYALMAGLFWILPGSVHPVWPLLAAALLSAVASMYLLRGMRERFALRVQDRASRMSQRFEESRAKEDVDDEAPLR